MLSLNRRSFLAGAAAVPFSVWLERQALAKDSPRVRYDARSSQGQAMLKLYAGAVGQMQSKLDSDTRSWRYQWYMHWVDGSTSKTAELNRVFPLPPSPPRALAQETWNTCQAHGGGEDENNFLPWHRLFVLNFENIIREISGHPEFTLPYWNYSAADPSIRGVIPPEFRKPGDALYKSLFIENRNPGVNSGTPIQQGQPGDPLSTSALALCPYSSSTGFCSQLDGGLHGNVHVLVGDTRNMGRVPYAARDPIFWMHHSNIDRLWASWNAGSRVNPALTGAFVFIDGAGSRVVGQVADVLDLTSLGYTYDHFEAVSPCPPNRLELAAAAAAQPERRHVATKGPIALGSRAVQVTLDPLPPPAKAQAVPFSASVKALPADRRVYLLVKDLKAQDQPGVLYHVYLELPTGAAAGNTAAYHVGAVNFFNAVEHKDDAHGEAPKHAGEARGPERSLIFDITDLVRKLQAKGVLNNRPVVTIAPVGVPAADAKPVIGEISIIEK